MVVHLGVVVIAVALAAATSFGYRAQVAMRPGRTVVMDGHRLEFVRLVNVVTPARTATEALVVVDGGTTLRPAVSQFGPDTEAVGTPAIDSGFEDDVYLTVNALPARSGGPVTIGVVIQPLVSWLWAGGSLLVLGSILAALPGRRRRATDPVSAPVPAVARAVAAAPPGPAGGEPAPPAGPGPARPAPAPAAAGAPPRAADPGEHAGEPVPVRAP
jgi:cytochrome c-type biogenesis protein CcmF